MGKLGFDVYNIAHPSNGILAFPNSTVNDQESKMDSSLPVMISPSVTLIHHNPFSFILFVDKHVAFLFPELLADDPQ
jgi:hypothetical protein